MKLFTCGCLLPLFGALLPMGAAAEECDPRFAKSPQFSAKDCTFQNPPNPHAKPHRSSWDIWPRILREKKARHGAGRPDPGAHAGPRCAGRARRTRQPHHPPGPLLAPAQAARQVVADRPGVRPRASPCPWAGPKRFHAPPVALEDVPPIEGLILSHDHYDHLDVPTIEALKDRVQRYFVPLGVGAAAARAGAFPPTASRSWTGGRSGTGATSTSRPRPRSTSPAARCGTATARCGPRGRCAAAANASSTAATRATFPASRRSASAWAPSTSR